MLLEILRVIIFFILVMPPLSAFGDQKIKQPNVSGQFYNADPIRLSKEIESFLKKANVPNFQQPIEVIIAPHAGYMYSGSVAAHSFKAVSQKKYNTVVILAPSHYVGFDGISIWPEGGFQTPLGLVEVDQDFTKALTSYNKESFYFYPAAFEEEHSLEVEIPFLQKVFKNFRIVPVIFGQPDFDTLKEFARALNQVIGARDDILIVVSTDLSHYHDDPLARRMDHHTLEAVKNLRVETLWHECHLKTMEMCGFVPVTAALLYTRERGLKNVEILRYANSGDVTGDRERVVGYGAVIISRGQPKGNPGQEQQFKNILQEVSGQEISMNKEGTLNFNQKKRLVEIARMSIEQYIKRKGKLEIKENDPRFLEEQGAFVTIHQKGRLRGCIGNILGRGPLYLTVRDMAIAAATEDPRFHPVKREELDSLKVEVSVLSKPRIIKNIEEIDLGKNGVIISQGPLHHGVFLPQVAEETGWSKEEFLSQLCVQKANLPADAWKDPKTKIEIFTAEVFSEEDVELKPHDQINRPQ